MALPKSLLQAMSLARLQEDNKFNDLKQFFKSSWQWPIIEPSTSVNDKPIIFNVPKKSKTPLLPAKRLSPAELKIRRNKG